MCFNFINKENFYENLFEYHNIPSVFHAVTSRYSNGESAPPNLHINQKISAFNKVHSFQLIPDYLNLKINEGLIERKVFQKHGYGINLVNCKSTNEYLQSYCSTNFRGNIRRSVKRIESSFNIHYNMFYGDISKENYSFLMSKFHDMLSRRFQQRNDRNLILENWNFYLTNVIKLINKHQASLFVIYNEKEPIAFSINFHYNYIFYFAIPTFNIDYYKFAPGNVVIYKNIDWCIMNNYRFFDMGYGGFENKIKWCNTTYNFNNHVVYKSRNILGNLYAEFLKNKYKGINYLIDKNINTKVRTLLNRLKNKKPYQPVEYELMPLEGNEFTKKSNSLTIIDNKTKSDKLLNKAKYDFLYTHSEHINNVSVYKYNDEADTYLILSATSQQKIKILR
jgi:hypothetical protein